MRLFKQPGVGESYANFGPYRLNTAKDNYIRTSLETQLPLSHTIMQDWLWVSDDVYENGILALTSLV